MKLISVIVPAYNIENYIQGCMDSILSQTYGNLEIIAVDDGSTDNTGKILDEYARKDQRIRVIHQENKGLSGARNAALEIARGEYIGYVDGDDRIRPEMYETMITECEKNNAEMAITAYAQIGENAEQTDCTGDVIPMQRDDALDAYICDNRSFNIYNSVWSRLYKADIVRDLRFPVGRNSEDIIYTTTAMCRMKKCVFIDRPMYEYTVGRPDSIMNVKLHERRFGDEIPFLKEQLEIFKANAEPLLYEKAVYHYCRRLLFYFTDFKNRKMKESARGIAEVLDEDRELIDEIYKKPFVATGDKKRMDLFLKSPRAYYILGRIYEDTVIPLRFVPKDANKIVSLVGNVCFYLGLFMELLLLLLDKAAYINPHEGWMFRVSFVLFLIKVICTKYSFKEYILMGGLWLLAFISYRLNTRDELVRFAVFLTAMKNIDLRHALKCVFKSSVFIMILLAMLSLFGILGDVFERYVGYGFKEGTKRLCLGLGSSNAFAIMIWALMLLRIYLYHERMKWQHYMILTLMSFAVYFLTLTRTTLAVMLLSLIAAFVMQNVKPLQSSRIVYILGGLLILAFVGFSVWSACVSDWHEFLSPTVFKINDFLTGRIENISRFEDGGGHISNWSLFSYPWCDDYFDMGYVRLYFWYGIIPASVCILLILYTIYRCYAKRDYMGFVMIMMFGLFTVVEAHIISVYIARNYLMFLMGSYLFAWRRTNRSKGGLLDTEEYLWGCLKRITGRQ